MTRGWIVAVVLGGACHAAIPALPSQGGPAWVELTSEHFTVWTDASANEGRELVKTMENLRQIVFGVSVFNPTSKTRAFVVALRAQREIDPYVPKDVIAVAWSPYSALRQPGIALSIEGIEHDRTTATHELTHVIAYNALAGQPRWFAEGLATYFQTVRLDDDSGAFEVGTPPAEHLRVLRRDGLLPVAELLACASLSCSDFHFYATAWALYAYLANKYPDDLLHYIQRLAELPPADQAKAWSEVFDLPLDKLDADLKRWVLYGELAIHRFKIKLRDWPVTSRTLGDSEVYASRAILTLLFHNNASAPIGAALTADPTNLVAAILWRRTDSLSADELRAIAAAHPDDWRAWWLIATAQVGDVPHDEAHAANVKLCALAATQRAVVPPGTCR